MFETSEIKNYQSAIMKNGIAHLCYSASDIRDIIHPLSVMGEELLSSQFLTFLEKYRAILPKNVPVVLEISGISLTEEEKKRIDHTTWTHFCMNMTQAENEVKSCIKRSILYLIYALLSTVLLFAVKDNVNELIVNLAYVPFWFFGYRVLIYLILDGMPLFENRSWYRQLASMKLVFPEKGGLQMETLLPDEVTSEVTKYRAYVPDEIRSNQMTLKYMAEKQLTELQASAGSLEDLIQMPALKGREFMSDTLADYLGQVEGFFAPDCRMMLEIRGHTFTEAEQSRIRNAIRNYYGFRIASEEKGILSNRKQMLFFGLSVTISSLVIIVWGALADIAQHEALLMAFWFFADYLLEFILISRSDLNKKKRILKNCMDMQVSFLSEQ